MREFENEKVWLSCVYVWVVVVFEWMLVSNLVIMNVSGVKLFVKSVSFNKPISLASLFAAMSSFLVRLRMWLNGKQFSSSERSRQSETPSHTSDISMQELGSDLQLNWFGLHLEMLFGWPAVLFGSYLVYDQIFFVFCLFLVFFFD